MFFKIATSFVAALFLGLLVAGIRQRFWAFVAMNFIGITLNVAVVLLDISGRLNMLMLLAATPALAFILAADVAMIFREPHDGEKPAAASKAAPVVSGPLAHPNYLFVTNEKRIRRELNRLANLSQKPRDLALGFWRQGNEAFRQSHYQQAEINYAKLIQLAPTPSALSNFAAIFLATNRAEAALQRCEESAALDAEHLETWLNRGGALLGLERLPEALACFEHAVALQPNVLEPWIFRGNTLIQIGQWQQSIECYDAALSLNPHRPECWNNRGVALNKMGKLPEAMASFEHALKIQPEYFPASLNRVLVIDKLGRFNQAKMDYRNFLKHAPPTLNGHLVFVRSRLHQLENGVASRVDLNQLEPELAL